MTRNRKYEIMPYNFKWQALFADESEKIEITIGSNIIETHHIGSTSVPGMSGKSTIDILFIVENIFEIVDNISDMQKIGYVSLGSVNAENTHLFEKVVDGERIFIVHFYPKDHPEIKQILAIRDYLRIHENEVKKYSNLKLDIFKKYSNDYMQYRKLKNEYMNILKEKAVIWLENNKK